MFISLLKQLKALRNPLKHPLGPLRNAQIRHVNGGPYHGHPNYASLAKRLAMQS